MSKNDTLTAIPALEPVEVTLELPGRIFQDYSKLTELGLYLSTEEALRQAVLTSWSFERGAYHSLRIEPADEKDAQEPAPTAEA